MVGRIFKKNMVVWIENEPFHYNHLKKVDILMSWTASFYVDSSYLNKEAHKLSKWKKNI